MLGKVGCVAASFEWFRMALQRAISCIPDFWSSSHENTCMKQKSGMLLCFFSLFSKLEISWFCSDDSVVVLDFEMVFKRFSLFFAQLGSVFKAKQVILNQSKGL